MQNVENVSMTGQGLAVQPPDFDAYIGWVQAHHGLSADEAETLREDMATALADDDYLVTWKASPEFTEWARTSAELEASGDGQPDYYERTVNGIVADWADEFMQQGTRNRRVAERVRKLLRWQRKGFKNYTRKDCEATLRRVRDDVRQRIYIDANSIRLKLWVTADLFGMALAEALDQAAVDSLSFFELGRICQTGVTFDANEITIAIADGWIDFVHALAVDRLKGEVVSGPAFLNRLEKHQAKLVADARAKLSVEDQERIESAEKDSARKAEISRAHGRVESSIQAAFESGLVPPVVVSNWCAEYAKVHKRDFPKWDSFSKDDLIALTNRMLEMGKVDLLRLMRDRAAKIVERIDAIATARASITSELDTAPSQDAAKVA